METLSLIPAGPEVKDDGSYITSLLFGALEKEKMSKEKMEALFAEGKLTLDDYFSIINDIHPDGRQLFIRDLSPDIIHAILLLWRDRKITGDANCVSMTFAEIMIFVGAISTTERDNLPIALKNHIASLAGSRSTPPST